MDAEARTPRDAIRAATLALVGIGLLAAASFVGDNGRYITRYLLVVQDLPVFVLLVVFGLLLRRRIGLLARTRLGDVPAASSVKLKVAAIGLLVVVIGVVGAVVLFRGYPLSMDEYWAHADGVIFGAGKPMFQVPQEWRPYAPALASIFARFLPDSGYWSSTYLPVNAYIQHLFGLAASPLMAGLAVIVAADLARQLLPGKRLAPLVCAVLMASSSQLLITAMTPYAMTGHLLLNLVWAWLFLRREIWAQVAAAIVAILATGLHQAAFFPLFALPFLLEAFVARRRVLAIVHLAVIAAAFMVWSNWDLIVYSILHVVPPAKKAEGSLRLLDILVERIGGGGLPAFGLMGANLLRFQLWQNPAVVPLMLLLALPVLRTEGWWRAMLLGIVLTTLFMVAVIPFQGHGWGYRYLHGLLGNACLLATRAFYELVPESAAEEKNREWRAYLAAMALFAMAILFPLHAFQAWKQAWPYVSANAALAKWDADVVVIDAPNHAYTVDLARNDPLLRNRPKRMAYAALGPGQLERLCRRYKVRLFDDAEAARFGIAAWSSVDMTSRKYPADCHFDSAEADK